MSTPSGVLRFVRAGGLYFLAVFSLGFLFGTVRVLVLEPTVGEQIGVLIEVPILLLLAWMICSWIMVARQIPRVMVPRLVVGSSAFILLMAAELALSLWLLGNSLEAHLQALASAHGIIGFAGQVLFALFPVLQLLRAPGQA